MKMKASAQHYWTPGLLCGVAQQRPCSYHLMSGSCLLPVRCVYNWKVHDLRMLTCVYGGLTRIQGFFFHCSGFIWGVVSHCTLGSLIWAVCFLPEFSVPASLVLGIQVATTEPTPAWVLCIRAWVLRYAACIPSASTVSHTHSRNKVVALICISRITNESSYYVCSRTGDICSAELPVQSFEWV